MIMRAEESPLTSTLSRMRPTVLLRACAEMDLNDVTAF